MLDEFCNISGQTLSETKSRVYFSPNVDRDTRKPLFDILGFASTPSLGKYLGFPLKHTYRSTQAYNFILDRVKQKLSDWKASMLSLAGRTILIQASSAAIPSYVMQLSYFPGKILDGIDRVNQNFLWRVIGRRKFIGLDGKRLPNQRRKGALGCNQPREEILHSLRNKLEISFRRGSFVGSSVKKKILLWKKSACC